ncbi:hypothetical protein K443DRAFT_519831 [Laccaria amethystina LaAM-08-1]|uniref:Uncharacterized protein n=1 Tax=Laccaria amethystina LaAM-08-1 TaxID=1095629 RepID=A0A0C9XLE5_9AGAR|nr:hypothetical protein K443DRAFT_519831 [Laccaria amethystina LaAM-08-1]
MMKKIRATALTTDEVTAILEAGYGLARALKVICPEWWTESQSPRSVSLHSYRTDNTNTSTPGGFVSRGHGHMQIRKVSDTEAGGRGYGCVQDDVH